MSTITYQTMPNGEVKVYVGGKRAGTIKVVVRRKREDRGGFYYQPVGASPSRTRGLTMDSVAAVKRSLVEG